MSARRDDYSSQEQSGVIADRVVASFLDQPCANTVMTQQVVTLRPEMSLAEAAAILLDHQVSGAPVVNKQGVCVGVLTAADIVKSEHHRCENREKYSEAAFWSSQSLLPADFYAERLSQFRSRLEPCAEHQVSRVMTRDLMTVSQRTALRHVIDCMVTAHVHRVFVLDSDDRLAGVITTMDVLAALLNHADQYAVTKHAPSAR